MAHVLLEGISKHFGTVAVIEHLDLRIEDQEFLVLVGPSGCGKSTALRMIAGLEEITGGDHLDRRRVVNECAEGSRRRDGLPELRALSAHDGAARTSSSA